jgi:VanZ family protein
MGILCIIAIVAILFATLWPFNPVPRNEATWLSGANGIRFGENSLVFSEAPLSISVRASADSTRSLTLELLLRPANTELSGNILAIYSPDNPEKLLVREWTDGLLVTHSTADARGKLKTRKFDVDHAFVSGKLLLLTITSGPNGTVVYRDGAHAQRFPRFLISPEQLSGQMVLGNSPVTYEEWHGEVCGLAVYPRELTLAEVSLHYADWTAASTRPTSAARDPGDAFALYTFNERSGQRVHSSAVFGPNLAIPTAFSVPHKPMLASPIQEFEPDRNYVRDIIANVAGFVPLGMILCAFFRLAHPRVRSIFYATLAGGILSFAVEFAQYYVPRRNSGTTDIITNTLGAFLGAALTRPDWIRTVLQVVRLLPAKERLASPQN